MNKKVFEDSDPFEDPAWKATEKLVRKGKRNARHIGCSVDWLKWVASATRSQEQLLTALLLGRRCHLCRTATVSIVHADFDELGIGRRSRYRHLQALEQAGLLVIEPRDGRRTRVTLLHWPDPPTG
jgi:hypothetical protein